MGWGQEVNQVISSVIRSPRELLQFSEELSQWMTFNTAVHTRARHIY